MASDDGIEVKSVKSGERKVGRGNCAFKLFQLRSELLPRLSFEGRVQCSMARGGEGRNLQRGAEMFGSCCYRFIPLP